MYTHAQFIRGWMNFSNFFARGEGLYQNMHGGMIPI